MNHLETRLRETLDQVAESTRVQRRADEITRISHRRPVPRLAIGAATFAVVLAVFALPLLLDAPPADDVASGGSPTPTETPVTINPAWLKVEADDLEAIASIQLPGDGDRTPLRSETIWCFYESGRPIEASASDGALDESLTAASLTDTCAGHPDRVSETNVTSESMTICRAVFKPDAYEEWATSGEMNIISGGVPGAHPGFPVVLGWPSDCVSESLTSNPSVTLTPDLSLEEINRARELEIAALGAGIRNCLSYNESQELAKAITGELGQQWTHTELGRVSELNGGCFQPFIDQQWGWVFTDLTRDNQQDRANQQDAETTQPTIAPTAP